MGKWKEMISEPEIKEQITEKTVDFAKRFGEYLGTDESDGGNKVTSKKLTTNQLRKFFGEVKRQQMRKFDRSELILLKPKLAYAVARAEKGSKIGDFYNVITDAIDKVQNEKEFKNFIKIFEAIVAYHKAAEENKLKK